MKRLVSYLAIYSFLLGIACRFGADPAQRPSGQPDGAVIGGRLGYVWGPDDGEWHMIPPNEGRGSLKAGPRSGVQQLAVFTDKSPTGIGPPLHRHDDADEIFYLHSGGGTWTMGDRSWDVAAGAMVFVPRGTWHTYRTTADSTEMIFVMSAPGLEEYLRTTSGVMGGPPAQPVTRELAEKYRSTACYQNGPIQCSTDKPDVTGYALTRDEGEMFAPDDQGRRTIIKASRDTRSPTMVMFTQDIPAGADAPPRTNPEAEEILYVDEGTGTATLNSFRFPVLQGSILFAPPGVAHGIENPRERIRIVGFAGRHGIETVFRNALTRQTHRSGFSHEQLAKIRQQHEPWRR